MFEWYCNSSFWRAKTIAPLATTIFYACIYIFWAPILAFLVLLKEVFSGELIQDATKIVHKLFRRYRRWKRVRFGSSESVRSRMETLRENALCKANLRGQYLVLRWPFDRLHYCIHKFLKWEHDLPFSKSDLYWNGWRSPFIFLWETSFLFQFGRALSSRYKKESLPSRVSRSLLWVCDAVAAFFYALPLLPFAPILGPLFGIWPCATFCAPCLIAGFLSMGISNPLLWPLVVPLIGLELMVVLCPIFFLPAIACLLVVSIPYLLAIHLVAVLLRTPLLVLENHAPLIATACSTIAEEPLQRCRQWLFDLVVREVVVQQVKPPLDRVVWAQDLQVSMAFLADRIIGFMDGYDLLRTMQLSRVWYMHAGHNTAWLRLCQRRGLVCEAPKHPIAVDYMRLWRKKEYEPAKHTPYVVQSIGK